MSFIFSLIKKRIKFFLLEKSLKFQSIGAKLNVILHESKPIDRWTRFASPKLTSSKTKIIEAIERTVELKRLSKYLLLKEFLRLIYLFVKNLSRISVTANDKHTSYEEPILSLVKTGR